MCACARALSCKPRVAWRPCARIPRGGWGKRGLHLDVLPGLDVDLEETRGGHYRLGRIRVDGEGEARQTRGCRCSVVATMTHMHMMAEGG